MRTYAAPRDTALVSGPTYSLYLSNDLTDIDTIARLRYRIFAAEPGFSAPASAAADQCDSDRFDEFCDHLMVRHNHTGQVVGSYRLLPPPGAIAAGGPYLTTEFDITELDPIAAQTVEMGRACVDAEHRSGAVLALMWSGILAYLERSGYCYLMGATSVPICTDPTRDRPGAQVRRIRDFVRDRHAGPWQVRPHRRVELDGKGLDDIDPAPRLQMPPLLSGYLRMGAVICGEPAHDPDFGVADFVTVLDGELVNRRYLDRLRQATSGAGQ
ncbi:UNVERIFIED_CONTAM: putative hemolysin [Williamsia faeni]